MRRAKNRKIAEIREALFTIQSYCYTAGKCQECPWHEKYRHGCTLGMAPIYWDVEGLVNLLTTKEGN